MEIAAAVIATVLLTVAAMAISRAGGRDHQEDLNDHEGAATAGESRDEEHGRPAEPKADRPAGPDAEAMGVAEPGAPSVDPASEEAAREAAHRR